MTELNKYSMYGFNFQGAEMLQKDKVDQMINEVIDLNIYKEVDNYIVNHFGDIHGIQWFDYPELNKEIYVLREDNKIEICMLKNSTQYYGKGWKYHRKN